MSRKQYIVKPRGDNVVVYRFKKESGGKKTDAGIHTPDTFRDSYDEAIVVDVGPGAAISASETTPMDDLHKGQHVLVLPLLDPRGLSQPAMQIPMKYDGHQCELVAQYQIMGILADPTVFLTNGKA